MPTQPAPSQWCPPEITDAAIPLTQVAQVLTTLTQERQRLARFADTSPDARVHAAFGRFVDRWDQASWGLAGEAKSLAFTLRMAAESYRGTEADLARRWLMDHPDHEGRRR